MEEARPRMRKIKGMVLMSTLRAHGPRHAEPLSITLMAYPFYHHHHPVTHTVSKCVVVAELACLLLLDMASRYSIRF